MSAPIGIKGHIQTAFSILRAYLEQDEGIALQEYNLINSNLRLLQPVPYYSTIVGFESLKDTAGLSKNKKANSLSIALTELIVNYQEWSKKSNELKSIQDEIKYLHSNKSNIINNCKENFKYLEKNFGKEKRKVIKPLLTIQDKMEDFNYLYSKAIQLNYLQGTVKALSCAPKFELNHEIKNKIELVWTLVDKESEILKALEGVIGAKYEDGKPVLKEKFIEPLKQIFLIYDNLKPVIETLSPIFSNVEYSNELTEKLEKYLIQRKEIVETHNRLNELKKQTEQLIPEIEPLAEKISQYSKKIGELKKDTEYQTIVDYKIANSMSTATVFDINSKNLGKILIKIRDNNESKFQFEFSLNLKNKKFKIKIPTSTDYVTNVPDPHSFIDSNTLVIGDGDHPLYSINLRI